MRRCPKCQHPICDYCKFFWEAREGEGYCALSGEGVDAGDGCGQFYCFEADTYPEEEDV